jgi:hypothetical protein
MKIHDEEFLQPETLYHQPQLGQQLINWAQQFSVPIIGTSNLSHLEENYRYLLNPKPVSIKPMMRHVLYPRTR